MARLGVIGVFVVVQKASERPPDMEAGALSQFWTTGEEGCCQDSSISLDVLSSSHAPRIVLVRLFWSHVPLRDVGHHIPSAYVRQMLRNSMIWI